MQMTEQEQTLLAQLDDMEKSSIRKGGDALQSAPQDGGFATEGTNIQSKAKAAKVKKAIESLMKKGLTHEDALDIVLKGFDDGSDDEDSEGADDSSDDSGDSMDDSSDEGDSKGPPPKAPPMPPGKGSPPMSKSLGAAQMSMASRSNRKESAIRKALTDEDSATIDAAPVLKALVDAVDQLAKSSSKRDDSSLRKSIEQQAYSQNAFNSKLAKALTVIADMVIKSNATVERIAAQPIANDRVGMLRKSDIIQPGFHNGAAPMEIAGGEMQHSPLMGVEMLRIQEALVDIVQKSNNPDLLLEVTKFENSKGNLSVLPPNILKQLETRLCPAS